MADKYAAGIKAGTTSVGVLLPLLNSADGSELTGKVAANLTASYRRQGGTAASISLTDLAAIDSAWSSGGLKEDAGGLYRIDLPDAAVATGADYVRVLFSLTGGGSYVTRVLIPLETKGAAEVFTLLGTVQTAVNAIKAVTDTLTIVGGKITAQIVAAGDFVQGAADKVWLTSVKALNSITNIVNGIWDEPIAGHLTASTTGVTLNGAAAAADPLLNPVPGAYAGGTAGYVIGHLSSDTTNINAIKTQTDQLTFVGGLVQASGSATTTAIRDAVWAKVIEQQGSLTAQQALSIGLAVLAGVTSNGGTVFKTPDGTTIRVQATTDTANERVTIVLSPSA